MNERLKELYRQAHSARHYDGHPSLDGNPPTVYWQDEVSAGRFAELIVRECLDIVERNIYGPHGEYDYSYSDADAAADRRAESIHDDIKCRFGVEE